MISVDEYRKLKRRSREVIRVEDLSDEDVAQIAEGRMDAATTTSTPS
jgi:hypothetical protein